MEKVLVTGGTGFIGSHTAVELINGGFAPVIIDSLANSERKVLKGIERITGCSVPFYKADYTDHRALKRLVEKESPSAVIHFAAHKAVAESVSNPLMYYKNNVAGFIHFVDMLLDLGIEKIIFSSSAAVYGEPRSKKVTEDSPCQPASPYGWSKYMSEIVLHNSCLANPRLKAVALRYFNVIGSHESAHIGELPKGAPQNLLPIIIQACAGKIPPFTIHGTDYDTPDGTCLRDYVHVVDLARAHVMALKKMYGDEFSPNFNVYNVGTGKPTSVKELITAFERVNKIKVPHGAGKRRPGDPAAYYASPAKIQKELGWKAEKTVEDAVRDAWAWQQRLTSVA